MAKQPDDICKRHLYIRVYPLIGFDEWQIDFVDIRSRYDHYRFLKRNCQVIVGRKLTMLIQDIGLSLTHEEALEVAKHVYSKNWYFTTFRWAHVRNA